MEYSWNGHLFGDGRLFLRTRGAPVEIVSDFGRNFDWKEGCPVPEKKSETAFCELCGKEYRAGPGGHRLPDQDPVLPVLQLTGADVHVQGSGGHPDGGYAESTCPQGQLPQYRPEAVRAPETDGGGTVQAGRKSPQQDGGPQRR